MSQTSSHRIAWRGRVGRRGGWWAAWLMTITINSVLAPSPALAVDCPRITTWSNQDASYFPVLAITRIDSSNTPSAAYTLLDNTLDRQALVTSLALTAGPSLPRDQLFANSMTISLASFASVADATTMFNRELEIFYRENGHWGYTLLVTGQGVLSYYADTPGAKVIHALSVYKNTIFRITLNSASADEDVQTTGLDQLGGRAAGARDLIDAKCGSGPENTAPSVYFDLGESSSVAAAFMQQMANGEIAIGAYDRDGRVDLDWSSFRVSVAGVDKTDHALQVVQRLAAEGRVSFDEPGDNPSEASYRLHLDRARLMTEHNLFDIAANGTWPVKLRLCDRQGACGEREYSLYFGPFLLVPHLVDGRCATSPGAGTNLSLGAAWGNNGRSTSTNFYVGLGPSQGPWQTWTTGFWTLAIGRVPNPSALQWFEAGYGALPVFIAPVALPSGMFQPETPVVVPSSFLLGSGTTAPFQAGNYTLVHGAVDLVPVTGDVSYFESRIIALCAPR